MLACYFDATILSNVMCIIELTIHSTILSNVMCIIQLTIHSTGSTDHVFDVIRMARTVDMTIMPGCCFVLHVETRENTMLEHIFHMLIKYLTHTSNFLVQPTRRLVNISFLSFGNVLNLINI